MLAPLAGRIVRDAPQQNAFPLDSTASMASLQDIYALIDQAARGSLSYEELDRRIGFSYYELPVDVVRSDAAAFASEVAERMEFVQPDRVGDPDVDFYTVEEFMTWLQTEWPRELERRDSVARLSKRDDR